MTSEDNRASYIQDPPADFGIRLMEGEEVIFSLRPAGFVRFWLIDLGILFGIILCTTILFMIIAFTQLPEKPSYLLLFYPVCGFFALMGIVWGLAVFAKRRWHYWLTNKRVIWCHGFIGYRVRSVPLERIADVIISRTFFELIAGITSIEVRDMTGQGGVPATGLSDGSKWLGVANAPDIQKRILEEVSKVNRQIGRV